MSTAPDPDLARLSSLSLATRVAGVVVAAGYLVGWVRGPVVAVAGALALVTFGRALVAARAEEALAGAAFAVVVAAAGAGALRWSSLQLDDIRAAQSVLGPTLLVGPPALASAQAVAAGAAGLALMVWSAAAGAGDRWERGLGIVEIAAAAGLVASVFWAPVASPGGVAQALAAVVAVMVVAGAGGVLLAGRRTAGWVVVTVAAVGAVASSGITAAQL